MTAGQGGEGGGDGAECRMQAALRLARQAVLDRGVVRGAAAVVVHRGQCLAEGIGERGECGRPVTADTQFQIGSITKAMTGLLVAQREAAEPGFLESKVRDHIAWPIHGETTLRHLCTHTSGLPSIWLGLWQRFRFVASALVLRLQGALARVVGSRIARSLPGAGYLESFYERCDDRTLEAWVRSSAAAAAAPGKSGAYSNMGAGVVGRVLGDYTGLVKSLLDRLHMRRSGLNLATAEPAQGYTANGLPVPWWTFTGSIIAAGGVYSTANDMAKLCQALLGAGEVAAWFKAAREPLAGMFGMFWVCREGRSFHNGQTLGFHSFLGVEGDSAVAVLANGAVMEIDEVANGMLDVLIKGHTDKYPPKAVPKSLRVGRAACEPFVGVYDASSLAPGSELKVGYAPVRRALTLQITGQPWFAAYLVEGETSVFYAASVKVTLAFTPHEAKLSQQGVEFRFVKT